jgi:periplasmic protein CpxP/Spy
MKFAFRTHAYLNNFLLATLMTTAGASAMAQGTPAAAPADSTATARPSGAPGERMGRHDPAKMQAFMAKRQAGLKAKLKITPAQEGAWTSFTSAMQAPAHARPTPGQRAELDKLGTPERIDRMRAMRTQRMTEMSAAMDKRGDATKALYAALSPEQQKVFDAEMKNHRAHHGNGGPGRHEGHRGAGAQKG